MDTEHFINLAKSLDPYDADGAFKLCLRYLRDCADGCGKDGKTATALLKVIEELIQ